MMRERLTKTLALFLPGIFLLGFSIGTGSVTSMAKAGATYGMSLLWTIVTSCLATCFMICVYGKFTLVTGETALQAFRKHIHPAVGVFFIVALTAGVCGSVMGVMGIVAEMCSEWSRTFLSSSISPVYFAGFFTALVYLIFWNGKTKVFERALALMVAIMAACFLLNFFITMPPLVDVARSLVPNLPTMPANAGAQATQGGQGQGPFLVIASMVGTTVYSGLFIIRTTLVKEAGWTIKDFKNQRNDAVVCTTLMFLISGAIMASAAGTLFIEGIGLSEATQMVTLLEPLAGKLATSIFVVGIVSAGVSSQFPNVLMLPWLLCDYNQSERDMTLPKYRVMVLLISLLGLVVPVFQARPVLVMIISQAFQSIVLPMTVGCILYLGNRKDLMGEHSHSRTTNVVLIAILAFSIVTSWMGIQGTWELITG